MRRTFSIVITALLVAAACFSVAACGGKKEDYGTLTIQDMTLVQGESSNVIYQFSDPDKAEEITYSFDGNDIDIKNDTVTALVGGKTVKVTAKTEHHETTFTVTTLIDYGKLTVDDITLEEGASVAITPHFSLPARAEEITYSFDGNDIEIEDGVVTALTAGKTVEVTAKTAHHETTFTVTTTEIDYGTLTISDITGITTNSNPVKIRAKFSIPAREEEITYSFEGNDIKIEDGYVTALVGGKTVEVTAKTAHHETTFTVTTIIDYGALVINDVYAWVDYPVSELDVIFEYPEYKEDLTYSYDETKLYINETNQTVEALAPGNFTVNVSSEHFKTTFTVHAEVVDKTTAEYDTSPYNAKVAGYLSDWKKNGVDGSTTLFIGDSFFDGAFWGNFYSDYAGKDVLRAGVSSATTYDWEVFTDSFLKYTNPKNIAMHIGTNNVYDDDKNAKQTVSALQRMFYVIHAALPETKIYWFNISQRTYNPTEIGIVAAVNEEMKVWCENRSWITLVDTSSKLTGDMLKDSVHPKPENYYIFVDELAKTDIVINDAPIKQGVDFTAGTFDKDAAKFTNTTTKRTRAYLMDGAAEYKGNYAVSGSIKFTSNGYNPWVELLVNKTPADDWFDPSSALPVSVITFLDGRSEIWGNYNGGSKGALTNVANNAFDFMVVVYNGSVLFKVNDAVRILQDEAFRNAYFAFGTENAGLNVTNLKITINDDAAVQSIFNQNSPTPSSSINDIVRDKSQGVNDGSVDIIYQNTSLNRNYILQGKLEISDYGSNSHIVIKFSGDENRILIWDDDSNGTWGIRWACGTYVNPSLTGDVFVKPSDGPLTLTWKLVVTASDAYFYANDELRLVWKNIPGNSVNLSSQATTCKFYEMTAMDLTHDKEKYKAEIAAMQDVIDSYASLPSGVTRV